jgi:peptidoglycan/xylan/chitin deacetylase (PgdA/CDA1 family)
MTFRGSFILTYHSLDNSVSPISVPPHIFEGHIKSLVDSGIAILPLSDVVRKPGVALTFDDAFDNFRRFALPILARYRLPATVFAVSGFCGKTNNWPGQLRSVPILDLLSWGDLRELTSESVTIGAHSVTHPNLARLGTQEAVREMRVSRLEIEDRIGMQVRTFAWPYGASSSRLRQEARSEFELVCGTDLCYLSSEADTMNLPRLDAYYLAGFQNLRMLATPSGRAYIGFRRSFRALRSALKA